MRIKFSSLAALSVLALSAGAARADIAYITNDAYIDSYAGVPAGALSAIPANSDFNYGGSAAVKVVVSNGSASYPGPSLVHTVFTLPDSFWSAIGTSNVATATVNFTIRTYNSGSPLGYGENVAIAPLLQTFKAGTGAAYINNVPQTMGGIENTASNPIGVDWYTSNGVAPWTTPGGIYDVNAEVLAAPTTTSSSTITFDIASLLNNPQTRAEIQANGLLLMMSNESVVLPANSQQFLSFYSSEGAAASGKVAPNISYIVAAVPEPASLGIITLGAAGLLARRRRTA